VQASGAILNDRYEVVRWLGKGSAGELLLVRDLQRDREHCALKILRPRHPDPGLTSLFKSEFLLLADVRHPCIVSVKDFAVLESGEPFFTMDYVPGENCRTFVQADRLDAHEYVELASGLLGALAHIHSHGMVHRDIKPENVIMRRGDGHLAPCLVDFGLAVLAAANRPGEATGTLPYIAPEILAGGVADARSDLFSLGMMLFEVCTGSAPAERRELVGSPVRTLAPDRIRRIFNRSARGSVPKRFEDFVARLLAPSPSGRHASAVAALQALRELYGEEAVGAPIEVAVRPLVSEAPLVGRGAQLRSAMMRADALLEGTLLDPILVVAGAEGSGVTRMLATLRNHAAVSGCIVCSGGSLEELVLDVVSHPQMEATAPRADEQPDELLFRADAALHALPHDEWPVLLLDDVHLLADKECDSLRRWVASLESRPGRARLLLVLGGRNEESGQGVELLKTAGRAVPLELRDLAPLTQTDIRGALSIVLGGAPVPGGAAQSLVRASGGNPRLFAELLRLLGDEGVLDFSGASPEFDAEKLQRMRLPKGAVDAARRRAGKLSKSHRARLSRLALVAESVSHASAIALVGDHRLSALVEAGFLARDRGRIGFPHRAAREAVDTVTGPARRTALEETAKTLAENDPFLAATLFVGAGNVAAARATGLPLARELLKSGRIERARELLATIAAGRPDGEVGKLYVRALFVTGRVEAAARLGPRLVEEDPGDVDLLMTVVSAIRSAGRPEEALERLKLKEGCADPAVNARIINARASMLNRMGRQREALEESHRAEEALGTLFDPRFALARTRANIYRFAGMRRAAMRMEGMIIDAAGDDHVFARAAALVNRAHFRFHAADPLGAIRDCRRAIRDAGLVPLLSGQAHALLGEVLAQLGRPKRAFSRFERARALFERQARLTEIGEALQREALVLLECGRPGEAEARIARAAALPDAVDLGRADEPAPSPRALAVHLAGDNDEAVRICEDQLAAASGPSPAVAILLARIRTAGTDVDSVTEAWRTALRHAWGARRRDLIAQIRVGVAESHARRGAWRLAEQVLDRSRSEALGLKSALAARAALLRGAAALSKNEPAAAGRGIEEAVALANHTDAVPLIAETYRAAASLLEEGAMQRFLRRPTGEAAASLLEVARDAWAIYGNEEMLRKIDLHLSELPRLASDPLGSPDADRLVKVLHVVREMNQQFDRDRLLQLILDRAIELTGAERGFVILLREGRQEVHIARNIDRESLSEPERKVSSRIISEVITSGRIVRSEDAELDQRFEEFVSVRQLHLKSVVAVPFRSGGKTIGALYLDNRFRTGNFTDREERLLGLFADQAVAAIDKAELVRELQAKRSELEELYRRQKAELKRQGAELRHAKREIKQHRRARGYTFDRIVARSVPMQGVVREAKRLAESDLSVLLIGESGTGKEMLAMAMHYASRRQGMPCLSVNCAAFPEGQLEAELFGHVRGSATEEDRDRPGLFEAADGGTLFIDEVGEMSMSMQVRLLRVLESGEVRRVGESKPRTVDVRVITATEEDLEELIRAGKFREDLYYRLSGFLLRLPPLRERMEDIEPLAYAFVEGVARREGRPELRISNAAIAKLESYGWGGNVRELRNVIMRAVVTAQDDAVSPEDVAFDARSSAVIMPGFDPAHADRLVRELANRGLDINERQQTAVARLLQRGKLAFGEYRRLFRVSKSTTARDLDSLLELGLLEKRGKTRAVVYLPGPKLREVAKKLGRA